MTKKHKGTPVFTDIEIAAIAKSMIFPEEGVGLYLDLLNQKMKEQSTKVSEVLKEAKLAPAEVESDEEDEAKPPREPFFTEDIHAEKEDHNILQEDSSTPEIKSLEEELESRNLSSLSKDILNNDKKLQNFIKNYDFLTSEGIDLDIRKISKNFASLAIAEPGELKQSYGKIIENGYSIIKPNGNLSLTSLLVSPFELDAKFDALRNVDAEDFYKLYPEFIANDANIFVSRISYCQNNGIEYKTTLGDKDIYLPVILSKEEFVNAGGVE